jgi:hypothetical protein
MLIFHCVKVPDNLAFAFRKATDWRHMDELMRDFLVETAEALDHNDLVRLEAAPEDKALISGIFRTLHTVKGTSGFLGPSELGRLAHAGENVLGLLREGSMIATPDVISGRHRNGFSAIFLWPALAGGAVGSGR